MTQEVTRTVALFGGSFNPPHVAHQMVCLYVLETEAVDQIWMIPSYRHPFGKQLASFVDRVAMCELATGAFGGRVAVSEIERELGGESSRTLDTIDALRVRHRDIRWRLVVGTDVLGETSKWHRWDAIESLAPPIVVGRAGHEVGSGPFLPAISSTEVRARIARGGTAVPLVPRSVMSYIAEKGLYQ